MFSLCPFLPQVLLDSYEEQVAARERVRRYEEVVDAMRRRVRLEECRQANFKKIDTLQKKAKAVVEDHRKHRQKHKIEDTPDEEKYGVALSVFRVWCIENQSVQRSDIGATSQRSIGGGSE